MTVWAAAAMLWFAGVNVKLSLVQQEQGLRLLAPYVCGDAR